MALPLTHLVLIDGMSFFFRAFHAVRNNLSRSDGTPTNALFGFSQMLVKVVDDLNPTHCAVVLDSKGKTFRHEMYPAYKANRPEPDEALIAQLEFLEPLIKAFGLPIMRQSGVEADDLIATEVCRHQKADANARITIVTSDKDLLQLVRDEPIQVRLLDTFKEKISGLTEAKEKFGVAPHLVPDVQGLIGDSSDNIPGVPGIGPKTATSLMEGMTSLEDLYANLDGIKNERIRNLLADHKEAAFLSRELARLKTDVPLPPDHALEFKPALHQAADYLRDEMEFRTLSARLAKRAGVSQSPAAQGTTAGSKGDADQREDGTSSLASSKPMPKPTGEPAALELIQTPWYGGDKGYDCIQTEAQWNEWLEKIRQNGWAAWDTETTGLDPLQSHLVGLSFAVAPGVACYVPVAHLGTTEGAPAKPDDLFAAPAAPAPEQLPVKKVLQDVQKLVAEGILMVAHNIKYDWQVIARALGITPNDTGPRLQDMFGYRYEDTILMSACLDGGRWNHNLNDLVARHLGHTMIKFEEVTGRGKQQVTFDHVPLDKATAYAAEDADATCRLFKYFSARMIQLQPAHEGGELPDEGVPPPHNPYSLYRLVEKPLVPVLVAIESRGVTVNTAFLSQLNEEFARKQEGHEKAVHALAGHAFNLNSPAQLGVVLFDELKLGTPAQQKKRSTGIDVLESITETAAPNSPAATLMTEMMAYRQFAKLRGTYTEAIGKLVNPQTGRVHTTYHQIGAATGRFSSTDPNLQNIPVRTEDGRKLRHAFVPQKGWVMVSADYSQIELRLLAHFSGSATLRQAFADGLDIHAYTAALVAGKDIKDVTREERRAAKFVNFGLVYGMGARSLAAQIGCSMTEAQDWIAGYFQRYTGVKEYMEENKRFARENGYVQTLLGRRIWLPDITSSHGGLRSNAERAAINAPLQGSNADVIKLAMRHIEEHVGMNNLKAQTLLQVHDELVLEAPPEEVETLKAELPRLMGNVVAISVPLAVEVGTGPDWESAH